MLNQLETLDLTEIYIHRVYMFKLLCIFVFFIILDVIISMTLEDDEKLKYFIIFFVVSLILSYLIYKFYFSRKKKDYLNTYAIHKKDKPSKIFQFLKPDSMRKDEVQKAQRRRTNRKKAKKLAQKSKLPDTTALLGN